MSLARANRENFRDARIATSQAWPRFEFFHSPSGHGPLFTDHWKPNQRHVEMISGYG
jgi:hypothetical protein